MNVAVDTLVNHVLFPLLLMRTLTNGSRFHRHLQFSVLGLLIQSYTLRRVIFYLPLEVCTFCNFKKMKLTHFNSKATCQVVLSSNHMTRKVDSAPRGCVCVFGGWGGGGYSFIWPRWVCAAEQGVVFRVLTLEQAFHHLAS